MATIKFYSDEAKTKQVYPEIDPVGNYPGVTVGLADNLISEDANSWVRESFQFRSTANKKSVADGYAALEKLKGALKTDTIPESINYNLLTTGVKSILLNTETLKTQISETGVYNFIYAPTLQYTSNIVSSVNKIIFAKKANMAVGNYIFNYTPVINTTDAATIVTSFNKTTFVNKVNNTLGTYTFIYNQNGQWYLNNEAVTLSEYGFTTTGAQEGNSIIVYYVSNSWYFGSDPIALSSYGVITKGTEKPGDQITINYVSNNWELDGAVISLATYGISLKNGAAAISDTIQIVYQAQVTSPVTIAKPLALHSVGRNQFDKEGNQIFQGYTLDEHGNILEDENNYVIYFKCLGGNTYTIYDKNEGAVLRAAYSSSVPATYSTGLTSLELVSVGSDTTTPSLTNNEKLKHYQTTADGYMVIATSDIDNLCCSLTWSAVQEEIYSEYWEATLPIPYTDRNGKTISVYGLPYINDTYYDEIDFYNHRYYVRVARVPYSEANKNNIQASVGENNMKFDSNYIYYGIDTITYLLDEQESFYYKVDDSGTEELIGTTLACPTEISYRENLKGKLRRDVEIIQNKVDVINENNSKKSDDTSYYPSVKAVWDVTSNIWQMLGLAIDTYDANTVYTKGDYVVSGNALYKNIGDQSGEGPTKGELNPLTKEPLYVTYTDSNGIIGTLSKSAFLQSNFVQSNGIGEYILERKVDSSTSTETYIWTAPDGEKIEGTLNCLGSGATGTGKVTLTVSDRYWTKSYLFKA